MSALEAYLGTLTAQRGATVPETSSYATLKTLLDEVGAGLRPRVTAVIHPKNTGAGIADLGLFDDTQPLDAGQKPARGVIEAKPVSDDLMKTAHSDQVKRYVAAYGQVLVTNYFQFVLVTRAPNDSIVIEERYDLAPTAAAFWEAAVHPRTLAGQHETALREYLLRVMRRNAPLASPQDVAWFLASYAREAKARLETAAVDQQALAKIRSQFEASLGIHFEDAEAEEFFRSTLVQTLFYGLFSAWVLWHEKQPTTTEHFDLWRDTRRLNMPVISELFEQFSTGTVLPLSVEQVLEWTTRALNRVDRAAFFATFHKGAAVQYFYEPFLEAFDPKLRRDLGVWYTPPEVVEYMVARVDAALKTELGIADGLADPNVYVLDPCCGTGAYLVAVLRHIYAALQAREGNLLAGHAVQKAMRERVFGFELLPAPFVVAHLQIGMLLTALGAPLTAGQRAGVYLTNALTGWDVDQAPQNLLIFPELQKERDAADAVKRSRPILVILGNPPYSGFAGVAVEEERALSDAYRTVQNPLLPRPQGQGLNDLYVRFYRMAERRIAEGTGHGVISFISNYSWLDGLSHTAMRERYLAVFDLITIDNLNGDKYKTGKTTPEGAPDPSIFSTEFNREGIQVGTAIATMIRRNVVQIPTPSPQEIPTPSPQEIPTPNPSPLHGEGSQKQGMTATRDVEIRTSMSLAQQNNNSEMGDPKSNLLTPPPHEMGRGLGGGDFPRATLHFRNLWGTAKRAQLTLEATHISAITYQQVVSSLELGLPFSPRTFGANYLTWAKLPDLFPASFAGVKTSRDDVVVHIDKNRLRENVQHYIKTISNLVFDAERIKRYAYRPMDVRWLYWDETILDRARPDYFRQIQPGNLWIEARQHQSMEVFDRGIFTRVLGDNVGNGLSSYFPLYLYSTHAQSQLGLFDSVPVPVNARTPNLSETAKSYLAMVFMPRDIPSSAPKQEADTGIENQKHTRKNAEIALEKKPYAPVYGDIWDKIKPLARQMRQEPTKAEAILWEALRKRQFKGVKFRRQHPIDRFIVDFYCAPAHLVIEIDGDIHDYTVDEDAARQAFIESRDLRVIRFKNEQVFHDLPTVLASIESALTPPPHEMGRGLGGGDFAWGEVEDAHGGDITLEQQAEILFYHALATLHAPIYRLENAGALQQDWPRVPLPASREALEDSAALGRQVAALLDSETPVIGVTQGDPRPDLRSIAVPTTTDGRAPDFAVTAGWGHFGNGSAVMPGRGRIVPTDNGLDIYLNDTTYWRGVPLGVWEYTLGGYQVLKKWLSYREATVLGRALHPEEAREFMYIARRITALLALTDALDTNYRRVTHSA